MKPDEGEQLRDSLRQAREDRDCLAAGPDGETGWMRDARVRRIAELEAVIAKLQLRIAACDQQTNRGASHLTNE